LLQARLMLFRLRRRALGGELQAAYRSRSSERGGSWPPVSADAAGDALSRIGEACKGHRRARGCGARVRATTIGERPASAREAAVLRSRASCRAFGCPTPLRASFFCGQVHCWRSGSCFPSSLLRCRCTWRAGVRWEENSHRQQCVALPSARSSTRRRGTAVAATRLPFQAPQLGNAHLGRGAPISDATGQALAGALEAERGCEGSSWPNRWPGRTNAFVPALPGL